ncbi:hypothetical protein ACTFIW_013311 [Dictyostelium discoideum]
MVKGVILKFQNSNDKPFTKRQDNYMKYMKEFNYELRHISGKKNGIAYFLSRCIIFKEEQINSQWLLEMKKNPNLCIEEINHICYLSEDVFKKLIIYPRIFLRFDSCWTHCVSLYNLPNRMSH